MPLRDLSTHSIKFLQILDEHSRADAKLLPKLTAAQLVELYSLMVLSRKFDEKAINLQRQGRIGTYASLRGQEAAQVGSSYALNPSDWMFPSFREAGAYITRGHPMHMIYQYWGGDERGQQMPKDQNNFTASIPVGSHMIHAAGAAMAMQYQKKKAACITYFGDGATSEGDFHEAMNFAGIFNSPVVFICQNNHYAISIPVQRQTASETMAQKAIAYGFEGMRVDGNDILAVYHATNLALEKARQGKGPTLIECFTYRMENHTTSDDSTVYRSKAEVLEWQKKDPIERFKKFLESRRLLNDSKADMIEKKAQGQVEKAVQDYESISPAKREDMFRYMFAQPTPILKKQMEQI